MTGKMRQQLPRPWPKTSEVLRCAEALKHVSSNEGGVFAKRVSRLASFRGGGKDNVVGSLTT